MRIEEENPLENNVRYSCKREHEMKDFTNGAGVVATASPILLPHIYSAPAACRAEDLTSFSAADGRLSIRDDAAAKIVFSRWL